MKKNFYKKLILNNRFCNWRLCILFSTIISISFVSWNLTTLIEIIFSLIALTYLFLLISKEYKELKKENGLLSVVHDAYDLNKLDLGDQYNQLNNYKNGVVRFTKSLINESELPAAKEMMFETKTKKIFFIFDVIVIESDIFTECKQLTVREYLNYMGILQNVKFKNENEKLLDAISPTYQNPVFLKRKKGSVIMNLMTKKEAEKANSSFGFEYLIKICGTMFLSMVLVASFIQIDSFIAVFIAVAFTGNYVKGSVRSKICADIVIKKEEFYRKKILTKLSNIKNGLPDEKEMKKLKSKDKDLTTLMESLSFGTSMSFDTGEVMTGISNIKMLNEGKDVAFTIKINGELVNKEYLVLLEDMGLSINDAFTEDSIDLYHLNFSF